MKAALETKELPETVKQLADSKKAVCVCALLHAEAPRHFALLVVQRSREASLTVRYWDTLPNPSMCEAASQTLRLLLEAAAVERQPLPAPANASFRWLQLRVLGLGVLGTGMAPVAGRGPAGLGPRPAKQGAEAE